MQKKKQRHFSLLYTFCWLYSILVTHLVVSENQNEPVTYLNFTSGTQNDDQQIY